MHLLGTHNDLRTSNTSVVRTENYKNAWQLRLIETRRHGLDHRKAMLTRQLLTELSLYYVNIHLAL